MADRAAREGCGPCAAKRRAAEARQAASNGGAKTAESKSAAEALIDSKPAGR